MERSGALEVAGLGRIVFSFLEQEPRLRFWGDDRHFLEQVGKGARCWFKSAALAMLCLLTTASQAAPVTYQDSLATDDARYALTFDLAEPTSLNAYTSSWANGGFAPVLTLFGAAGGYQQATGSANVCGVAPAGAADPANGFCWVASAVRSA